MFGTAQLLEGTDEDLRDAAKSTRAGLKSIIENGQKQGVFKTGDPERSAMAAWSLVHGLSTLIAAGHWPQYTNTEATVENMIGEAMSLFFQGLCRNDEKDGTLGITSSNP